MQRPCRDLPAGHRHCKHGHSDDCPDVDNCELLPKETPKLYDRISVHDEERPEEDKAWPPTSIETK